MSMDYTIKMFLEKLIPKSKAKKVDPDPEDININNAYKTRWVWYHTILALELLMTNMLLFVIVVQLASK